MKKQAKYIYTPMKGVRCYVEANSAEEADKLFNTLVKDRALWQIGEVKDTTGVLERFAERMQKQ